MRFLWLLVPVFLVFSGCGPAPKRYSRPTPPKVFDGKKLGNSIFYYTKKDLIKVATNNYKYLSNADDVKNFLFAVGFVKKEGNIVSTTKLDELNYTLNERLKKLEIKSFTYRKTSDEYLLSGRYVYTNEISLKGKTNKFDWPVRFIAVYDKTTKELKGMYYNTYGKYNQVILSKNGSAAWFTSYHGGEFLNLDTNKTSSLKKVPFYTFEHSQKVFSKNGNYFAMKLTSTKKGSKDLGILLYDIKNGKIIFNKTFYYNEYSTGYTGFTFSEDEKYFVYKTKNDNFKVFDLVQRKNVDSFGKNFLKKNVPSFYSVGDYVFSSLVASEKGKKTIYTTYVYDTKNKEIFCQIDAINGQTMFIEGNGLNVIKTWGRHDVYNFEKNNCFKVKTINNLGDLYGGSKVFTFTVDNTIHYFENGKITTRYVPVKYRVSQETKEAVQKINRMKKFYQAGFKKKAFEKLRSLILDEKYDYFAKQYTPLTNFLSGPEEAYVNLLAYKRYVANGQRDMQFERSVRNYIFFASRYGFKDLIPPFITEYKKAIGDAPSKLQKERLALYNATYLLDIGKDAEAYELLFEYAPFGDDAKSTVKRFSGWNFGLTKDKKKLAVAMDIKESDLKNPEKKITSVKYFYDFHENKITKGVLPKKTEIEQNTEKNVTPKVLESTPKQEAIKLLD